MARDQMVKRQVAGQHPGFFSFDLMASAKVGEQNTTESFVIEDTRA
jgi:hypothetical protein